MELFLFARFHVREGREDEIEATIREVVAPSREEPGCLAIDGYRSTRDPRLFYVHSRWTDEAAFDRHAELPHTVRFIARVELLVDQPLEVTRTLRLEPE
jgi:quinol monooxygenase YgiN